ncbi:hypothetical protein [Phreatobacter sp.]|uniref:hypothetical protein n=1 Tax=Phreatobacter sp. TaxID=1966341 RepID=UPI003F6F744C
MAGRRRRATGPVGIGHNGGPPLEEKRSPPWGKGDPHRFLTWSRASKAAWKPKSRDVALFRLGRAEKLGLTYEEYTLEVLERGRFLQEEDGEQIAAIKAGRRSRRPRMSAPRKRDLT